MSRLEDRKYLTAEEVAERYRGAVSVAMRSTSARRRSFPVTLYKEQWLKLLSMSEEIRAFIVENEARLKAKD